MLNSQKTEYSEAIINEQLEYVKMAYPFIKQIHRIDTTNNLKADYIYQIDAVGTNDLGKSYTIQLKHREAGKNDLILPTIKLTGNNVKEANLGFKYRGSTYTFRPVADIYVETIADKHYTFTANELLAIEKLWADQIERGLTGIQPKNFYDDKGNSFFSGEFMAFMPTENMQRSQQSLLQLRY